MSDAILDVVRGLTTVASFSIIADQVKAAWETLFTHDCHTCRGTGKTTCPKCQGSKTMRSRPATMKVHHAGTFKTNPDDLYPCFHCGPPTLHDLNPEQEDDLDENYQVMENLKTAAANRRAPQPFAPTAGTVACPDCRGQAIVYRHTPNLDRMFNMETPFWVDAAAKRPIYEAPGGPAPAGADFWEYPGLRSEPYQPPRKKDKAKSRNTEGGGVSMTATEQYSLEDYLLSYQQDNEEPAQRARKQQ